MRSKVLKKKRVQTVSQMPGWLCVLAWRLLSQHRSSNSATQPEMTREEETQRGRQWVTPPCRARREGYLGWQKKHLRSVIPPPPSTLCWQNKVLRQNICATDHALIRHSILGNWNQENWFDWLGGRITRASYSLPASWIMVGSNSIGSLPHVMYPGLFILIVSFFLCSRCVFDIFHV